MAVQLDNSTGETIQKSFLANPRNKESLIDLLSYALSSNNHNVVRSSGDADTVIVSNVLDFACLGHEVELIGADTDLSIMLIYMWNEMIEKITMKSEATRKQKDVRRDIEQCSSCLGDIRKYITLIHAFAGCDTTSSIYGHRKMRILRLLQKNSTARTTADQFLKADASQEEIGEAGIVLTKLIYGGTLIDTLGSLRYVKYMKITSAKQKLEKLPPTERVAYFHSLHVYHQVREWNTLEENNGVATEWGLKIEDNSLRPILTDEAPAPDEILNVVRCNCSMGGKNPCGGSRCSCVADGLKCVPACWNCRGSECLNYDKTVGDTSHAELEEEEDTREEEDESYDKMFESLFN